MPGSKELNITVTYHDSCHLNRKVGVKKEPRTLLQSIKGINFVEMPEADRCCGGAGTFNIKQYDISMKILKRKMDNFSITDAEVLTVGCPSCRMQLTHGLEKYSLNSKDIRHPVEILAMTYKDGGE
ncbi:MAG: glycolate oxidase iron-sulfur subunit [Clostridia bacterium]|jgi:glycolate oxidase iron-sulfur subunit|nr:glycolate oxidase iron-sulfur subunit [Clostridia bacterium]MDN5321866.1 glycolate oxidase iron-sulfur subunit [Clostridia bacterium]